MLLLQEQLGVILLDALQHAEVDERQHVKRSTLHNRNIRSSEEFAEKLEVREEFAEDLLRDFGLRIIFL